MNIYQKSFFNGRLYFKDSLRDFAFKLGINHSLLHRIEKGTQTPSYKLVEKLISLTGYELPELISGKFSKKSQITNSPTITLKLKKITEMNFNEFTAQQRLYLHNKWSVEIKELKDDIIEAKLKLTKRIEKSHLAESEISFLKTELANSKYILTHLQNTGASESIIANQQALVTLNENRLAEKKSKSNILTDEEAVLEQAAIDELDWKIQYRETKIAQINAII
jgi:transcriptional regulator with XRE-family HTH domain